MIDHTPPDAAANWLITEGVSLGALLDNPPREPRMLIEGLVPSGCLCVLHGQPDSNKSFLVLDLALAVASGTPFLGLATRQAQVAYITPELTGAQVAKRLQALMTHRFTDDPAGRERARDNLQLHHMGTMQRLLNIVADLAMVRQYVAYHRLEVVVFDTLARTHSADENSNAEMQKVMNAFTQLQLEFGLTLLIVHHEPKAADSSTDHLKAMRGAGAIAGACQAGLRMLVQGDEQRQLVVSKGNWTKKPAPFFFRVRDDGSLEQLDAPGPASTQAAVLQAVEAAPGSTREAIAQALGKGGSTVGRHLKALREAGQVVTSGSPERYFPMAAA